MKQMDMEKVVNALECCIDGTLCSECGYEGINRCFDKVLPADALSLLKEQEEEIKRLKGELHGFGDLFHTLSEKAKVAMAEQPKVIRCKDCQYFQMHEWSDFHIRIWPEDGDRWYECLHPDDDGEHGTRTKGPEWFCADGERK